MSTTAQSLSSFKRTIFETIQLFRPEAFRTKDGRDAALTSLKTIVKNCRHDNFRYFTTLTDGLLESEVGLLEYIYAKDPNIAYIIQASVLGDQASNDSLTLDSLWCRALLRLSDFFLRIPPTIPIPNYQKVTKAYQTVVNFQQTPLQTLLDKDINYPRLLKSVLEFYLTTLSSITEDIVHAYEQLPSDGSTIPTGSATVPQVPTDQVLEDNSELSKESKSSYSIGHLCPAALFDARDANLGPWHILFSTKCYGHWKQLGKADPALFKVVHRKLRELSYGLFSGDNQAVLAGEMDEVPIFSARLASNLHLIYKIDCGFPPSMDISEVEGSLETQMIRIFGIYEFSKINRPFWRALAGQSRKLSEEHRRRCRQQAPVYTTSKGYYLRSPLFFEFDSTTVVEEEEEEDTESDNQLSSEDYVKLHSIIAVDKYVPYGRHVLEACRNDEELTSVFAVSREEEMVIYHPSSSIVIGRSGTGKTTTMIFKMIALEKAASQAQMPIRQVFVTQSAVLAKRVAAVFDQHRSLSAQALQPDDFSILDLVDEVIEAESTLPSQWSLVKQEDFPLFVTFEQLCRLLQADIAPDFGFTKFGDVKELIKFEDFLRDIWPHFNQRVKRGLDASLVWSEFMGVIKGSEQSLKAGKGYIDRDTYLSISSRLLPQAAKSEVYSLFESYLKQKRDLGRVDPPERTHTLLRAINSSGLIGESIDFLYVDEVQDNLLLDAGLLRKLCDNPNGLFWAGDSAQTIAVGSSFRFSELKSYLRNDELRECPDRKPVLPHTFQLAVNYRSQGGIVNAAASLVEMIQMFFPNSIDKLSPERSKVNGPKPIIFFPVSESHVEFENFLFGTGGSRVEFGAEQAILVRNENVQKQLRDQIGDLPLVLTLYESKGLEFNDVLLYDFFADSPASATDWRVVLNCMQDCSIPAPQFNELRHAIIQTELKFLYVGLTRARNRVWIWDSSDKIDPMRMLWSGKGLINIKTPDDIPRNLAVRSSEHAWKKRACALFQQNLYDLSISAFRRAGMETEEAIAGAFKARSEAEKLPSSHSGRSRAWELAAAAFDAAQHLSPKNELQQRRLRLMAAESYTEVPDYARAAMLFELSRQYTKAVLLFRKAGLVDNAMEVLRSHRKDIELPVVKQTESIAKVFYTKRGELKKARDLFRTPKDHTRFLEDLGLDNMLIEVYEDMGEFDKAAQVASRQGEELRAARLHLKSTDARAREQAMKSLLNKLWKHFMLDSTLQPDDPYVEEVINVAQTVRSVDLDDWNEVEVFAAIHKGDHEKLRAVVPKLLDAKRRASAVLAMEHYLHLRGFSSIRTHPYIATEEGKSLGKIEDVIGNLGYSLEEIVSIIDIHSSYSCELRSILLNIKQSIQDPEIQKLLRFSRLESVLDDDAHEYLVPRSESPPLNVAAYARSFRVSSEGVIVNQEDMERVLLRSLCNRYNEHIRDLHELIIGARAFRPCPLYPLGVACVRDGGFACRYDHLDTKALSSSLPIRVRCHLRVILLLDSMMPDFATVLSDDPSQTFGKKNMQRKWLERLFECLYPASPALGTLPLVGKSVFMGHPSWLPAVQAWLKARIFLLKPEDAYFRAYMSSVISLSLLGSLLDTANYSQYTYEAGCAYYTFQRLLYRPDTRATIVRDVFDCLRELPHTPAVLYAAVASIEHIASRHELPVDINALTTYIERLATFMIIHFRLCCGRPVSNPLMLLNDLTMPRSWMIQGLACFTSMSKNPPAFHKEVFYRLGERFCSGVREIMVRMRGPPLFVSNSRDAATSLFHKNRVFAQVQDFGRVSIAINALFRARLCRTLVLLAHNFGQPQFQDRLVQYVFKTLWEPRPHDLYAKFVRSRSWVESNRALYESPLNVPSDQLCNLVFQTPPQMVNKIREVFYIFFSSQESLFSQMGLPDTAASLVSDSQCDPIISSRGVGASSHQSPYGNDEGQSSALRDQRTTAVEVIAGAYKRHLKHQSSPKSGNHFFDLCFSRVNDGDGKSMPLQYVMAFLGPLPHLLAWFEEAMRTCAIALKQQSILLADENYDNYDESFKIIAKLKPLRKDLKKLSRQLSPQSDLHSAGILDKLNGELKKVIPLKKRADTLLPPLSESVLEDYRLASLGLTMQDPDSNRDME
ncbi:hypothetical protein FRC03_010813 [Tulasnella sp. 419]|nr:hypothetical protein FRC03_010813 [Tulasnella sp. 419]